MRPMIFSNLDQAQKYLLIVAHIGMAALFNAFPVGFTVYFYALVMVSLFMLLSNRNKEKIADILMAYSVGVELAGRVLGNVIPHGASKYSIIMFVLVAGVVSLTKNPRPTIFIAFMVMLLPSMYLSEFGSLAEDLDQWSYYMSGPLSLGFAALYFHKRVYTMSEFKTMLLFTILPIILVSVVVILRLPSLSEIVFSDKSKYSMSGGFGPNQVSLTLGYGLSILFLGYFMGFSITGKRYLDLLIGVVFFTQSALTFSRGGILNSVIVIVAGFLVWYTQAKSESKGQIMLVVILSALILVIGFEYANNVTGGALEQRYLGTLDKKEKGVAGYGAGLSGRDDIALSEWNTFIDNPSLGVGVGMSAFARTDMFEGRRISSHTEYTRLIAEHGMLGLFSGLILIFFPIFFFVRNKEYNHRILVAVLCLYALFAMTHTAMRLGLTSFAFGFGLITLIADPVKQFDPEAEARRRYLVQKSEEENYHRVI